MSIRNVCFKITHTSPGQRRILQEKTEGVNFYPAWYTGWQMIPVMGLQHRDRLLKRANNPVLLSIYQGKRENIPAGYSILLQNRCHRGVGKTIETQNDYSLDGPFHCGSPQLNIQEAGYDGVLIVLPARIPVAR